MTTLRVIVVDDEPLARERITTFVRETPGLDLVAECANGLEALDLITRFTPDLVLIDVEMPELDGFGVIAALDVEKAPAVVFVTAYERYAVHAFDVGAVDYLHKPVTRERFGSAIARARLRFERHSAAEWSALVDGAARAERSRGRRVRYVVRRGNAHYFVPVAEIDWIDVADNYLRLHVGERMHLARATMKQAEDELDPAQFVRVHRSAIVRIEAIATVRSNPAGGHVLQLKDGTRLRSSRQFASRVSSLLR